jgi:hypothetical protein
MPRQRQAHRSGEAAPGRYPWPEAQNGGDVRPEGPRTASLSPTQMTRGSEPPPPSPCRSRLRFVGGRIPSERGREVLALVLRVRKSLVSLALPDYFSPFAAATGSWKTHVGNGSAVEVAEFFWKIALQKYISISLMRLLCKLCKYVFTAKTIK